MLVIQVLVKDKLPRQLCNSISKKAGTRESQTIPKTRTGQYFSIFVPGPFSPSQPSRPSGKIVWSRKSIVQTEQSYQWQKQPGCGVITCCTCFHRIISGKL